MYPGISTQIYSSEKLTGRLLETIGSAGFGAVEIFGMPDHFDYADREQVKEIAGALEGTGLKAAAVHAPYMETVSGGYMPRSLSISLGNPGRRERVLGILGKVMEAAAEIGSKIVVIHFGSDGDRPKGDIISNIISSLNAIREMTVATGVRAAFENIATPISGSKYMNYLMESYGFEDMGICLDIAHANINEEPAAAVGNCGKRLIHIHASDNRGLEDDHKMPFDGSIRWHGVMAALKEIQYDGCFSFELKMVNDPVKTMKKALRIYDKLVALGETPETD